MQLDMFAYMHEPYKITTYVLVGYEQNEIIKTDVERIKTLFEFGVNPFAMGYIDFNNPNYKKTDSIIQFCRWVNHKAIFKTTKLEEYGHQTEMVNKGQISLFKELI
jgi:hypothetical protein